MQCYVIFTERDEIMKFSKRRNFVFALALLFGIALSNPIMATDCNSKEKVCAIYDSKLGTLKLYGSNDKGQLGQPSNITSLSKEDAVDVTSKFGGEKIESYKVTKNNVFVHTVFANTPDYNVYASGANNINQLGVKGKNNRYGFIRNPLIVGRKYYHFYATTNTDYTTNRVNFADEISGIDISAKGFDRWHISGTGLDPIENQPVYYFDSLTNPETGKLIRTSSSKRYNNSSSKKHNIDQLDSREEETLYTKNNKIASYTKKYTYINFPTNSKYKKRTVVFDTYINKYNEKDQLSYKYRVMRNKKNKVTSKDKYVFNGKTKSRFKINYLYQKNNTTLRIQKRYFYNKNSQLKSNSYGKAYRYTTIYSTKGKALRSYRQQYNASGKLSKKQVKVKLIK